MFDYSFYSGKKVLITGHTGFKGSWLCKTLVMAGADVVGYALEPPTIPNLYNEAELADSISSYIGDIRDYDLLKKVFDIEKPEIVFHLAAQPIVLEGYNNPKYTYETNVIGTLNVLESIRETNSVKSVINITTDKVYKNDEIGRGFIESDYLDGFDPYSNSKSCSELVTHCYQRSFLSNKGVAVSTARAGNVIGGGDFSSNRIIPDCIRAIQHKEPIIIRNPDSVRPFQHVLDPIFAYLMIAAKQFEIKDFEGSYNVGPEESDCINTEQLVSIFEKKWGEGFSHIIKKNPNSPHEARLLMLDCSKLKKTFGWKPVWTIDQAVEKTVDWTKLWISGNAVGEEMEKEIEDYMHSRKE